MSNASNLELTLQPLINEIKKHPVFSNINSLVKLRIFMNQHSFVVWDFMCLLKQLYNRLINTVIPWYPSKHTVSGKLISQIILEEEFDLSYGESGVSSHFELYIQAMTSIKADTFNINNFIINLSNGYSLNNALEKSNTLNTTKEFVKTTFSFFNKEVHELAAAFVFGREAITSPMFTSLIRALKKKLKAEGKCLDTLLFYLDRHIELDANNHFPKALKLVTDLVNNDDKKWHKVKLSAEKALVARINFLDGVYTEIKNHAGKENRV